MSVVRHVFENTRWGLPLTSARACYHRRRSPMELTCSSSARCGRHVGARPRPGAGRRSCSSITGHDWANASACPAADGATSPTGAPGSITTSRETPGSASPSGPVPPERFRGVAGTPRDPLSRRRSRDSSSATALARRDRLAVRRMCDEAGVRLAYPCTVGRIERLATRFPQSGPDPERFSAATSLGHVPVRVGGRRHRGLAVPLLARRRSGTASRNSSASPSSPRSRPSCRLGWPRDDDPPLARWQARRSRPRPAAATRAGAAFLERALVTHRGLSGPAILQIFELLQAQATGAARGRPVTLDLLPGSDPAPGSGTACSRATLPNLLARCSPAASPTAGARSRVDRPRRRVRLARPASHRAGPECMDADAQRHARLQEGRSHPRGRGHEGASPRDDGSRERCRPVLHRRGRGCDQDGSAATISSGPGPRAGWRGRFEEAADSHS